jgi:hypothetical protein
LCFRPSIRTVELPTSCHGDVPSDMQLRRQLTWRHRQLVAVPWARLGRRLRVIEALICRGGAVPGPVLLLSSGIACIDSYLQQISYGTRHCFESALVHSANGGGLASACAAGGRKSQVLPPAQITWVAAILLISLAHFSSILITCAGEGREGRGVGGSDEGQSRGASLRATARRPRYRYTASLFSHN